MIHIKNPNILFIAKVDEQKRIKNLTNNDIANMTGYKKGTIDKFMAGFRDSDNIKTAISKALEIEI